MFKNCGQVNDYLTIDEYVDFYENRHKMKRKSVYHRKYHILNVINDIAQNSNIQVRVIIHYETEICENPMKIT